MELRDQSHLEGHRRSGGRRVDLPPGAHGPHPREESFEVTQYDPDHRIAIEGTLGPFAARLTYQVEPVGDATLVTNDVELNPTGLARLVAPIAVDRVKGAVAANLDVLKQRLA